MTLTCAAAWDRAEAWCQAWNTGDLDVIMEHYAPMVSLSSPTVVERWGLEDGWLHGWDALRNHFAHGLDQPKLSFTLEDVRQGHGVLTIVYRRETGALVSECMELDDKDRARRVVVSYGQPATGSPTVFG